MANPLSHVVADLRSEPSRTGSIVITLFGDAIVPRGGSVWLGTLLAFFETLEIDGGVVRTAMSRLTAQGWFARCKVGRNSFYRLAGKGHAFSEAVAHVYDTTPPPWSGRFQMLLAREGTDRGEVRDALRRAGFGSPMPGTWIAPLGRDVPPEAARALRLEASASENDARALAEQSWVLGRTADAYKSFMATFDPVRQWIARDKLSDADAFTARIMLVHHYRRIMLHDPLLPEPLLPPDWPGIAARQFCRELYRALIPASEQWLDEHGASETGPLPKASEALWRRFSDNMLQNTIDEQ